MWAQYFQGIRMYSTRLEVVVLRSCCTFGWIARPFIHIYICIYDIGNLLHEYSISHILRLLFVLPHARCSFMYIVILYLYFICCCHSVHSVAAYFYSSANFCPPPLRRSTCLFVYCILFCWLAALYDVLRRTFRIHILYVKFNSRLYLFHSHSAHRHRANMNSRQIYCGLH